MNNRALAVICSLCLLIGALIGAIAMAIVRPSTPAAAVAARPDREDIGAAVGRALQGIEPGFQQSAEQGGKPVPTDNSGPYPGSLLIHDELKVLPREAKVIRDMLRKQTHTGVWRELEWTRKIPTKDDFRLGKWLSLKEGDYGIILNYQSATPLGVMAQDTVYAGFYKDGSIKITGGPLPHWETFQVPKTQPLP